MRISSLSASMLLAKHQPHEATVAAFQLGCEKGQCYG
jgi:hypothetical protein